MPGLVMAAVAVTHVFLAQFAVGGGFLLCYFQWLAMSGQEPHARQFVAGYFKVLVLVSFVVGAMTGVGIWFTAIQVSAPTIGAMVENFHWFWAVEYTFFFLEIVSGYCFYRYHDRLPDWVSLTLLGLYSFAAWMSLFWINGILSWQLTPGVWIETHAIYDGFANPSFWPSLLFRTVVAFTLAALGACVIINFMGDLTRHARRKLINRAAHLLVPMILMPVLGVWYLAVLPEDSRSWVLGGSPAMMMFFMISTVASVAIGAYSIIGLVGQRLYVNGATATLLLFMAYGATAGGEFVREGSRKPYSIRYVLFSNAIRPEEVARLREVGCVADDPYPVRGGEQLPSDQLRLGAKVYRRQCSVCHTLSGANNVVELTATWDLDQMRMNIAKLQHTKPFMPPFAGTADEVEALVQFFRWKHATSPGTWPESHSAETRGRIAAWLTEAGVNAAHPADARKQP